MSDSATVVATDETSTEHAVVGSVQSLAFDVARLWSHKLYDRFMFRPKAYYQECMDYALTYEDWLKAATLLDDLEGWNAWKQDPASPDYDWELVQTRLEQLKQVRASGQSQSAMIFALRTSLARNLGDMGNPKLYTRVGTKELITTYIDQVVEQLNWVCDEPSPDLDLRAKHDFFMTIRQSFGRTALLLSGGGTLGLNHLGVIKCLHKQRMLPRIISGASSGSIMAALVCTKTDAEIPYMFNPAGIQLDVFERKNQPDTPLMRIHRLLSKGQLYDLDILRDAMRENLGDMTFQEAFNRTRWILNITVSSTTLYDMPRLLNYITAPDVLIWSAVAVSCSVPVFYGSSQLYVKDKTGNIVPWNPSGMMTVDSLALYSSDTIEQLYMDGSVDNDLPMNKLSELFHVNHFIVCQVNPHVIPFLQKSNSPSCLRKAANVCMHLAKTEVQHRCTQLTELGVAPALFSKVQSIMSQKYSGDITIIPKVGYSDFLKVLSNPTNETVMESITRGERATWPKLSIIKNHLQVELTIDACLYRLRLRRLSELPYNVSNGGGRPLLENRASSHLDIPRQTIESTQSTPVSRGRNSAKRELAMTATTTPLQDTEGRDVPA